MKKVIRGFRIAQRHEVSFEGFYSHADDAIVIL